MGRSTSSMLVAALCVSVVAASCASGSSQVTTQSANSIPAGSSATVDEAPQPSDVPVTGDVPTSDGPASTDISPTDQGRSESSLDWAACPDSPSLQCATLTVPLDYADPDGRLIDIAVARSPATGAADDVIGSLVFNPGGPGGSGIESLEYLPFTMSTQILDRFDIVSFDPRGVGVSTAAACDTDVDDRIDLLAADDDAGWDRMVADRTEQLSTCTPETIELAPFLGTNNAARDLDVLRSALGDTGLSFVGYSYGTRLGATYAELFPDRVRALVLDAAVKPTSDAAVLDREQGAGFDRALDNFAAACDADVDCLLRDLGPTLDVLDGLAAEIAEVGTFATDGERVLTEGEFFLGVLSALYSKESWPFLASALFTAETSQDGTLLQVLGDSLVGRRPDGSYDNSNVANMFINCADEPRRRTADEQRAVADEAAERSAFFGNFLRGSTGCLGIDVAVDPLVIGPADGSAPIVVIGNTGDPATPYGWSVELAALLSSAVLYTVEAEGHTAYGTIDCVQADIDAYLVDLVVPDDGSTCSDNATADFFVPAAESEIGQLLAFFDCVRDQGVALSDVTEADVLADPTLETVLAELDFSDRDVANAVAACQDLLPV